MRSMSKRVRHARDQVAEAGLQRIADEATPLRPPGVGDGRTELAGEQRHDPVLEAFAPLVGEGEVVGIGADPQLPRRGSSGAASRASANRTGERTEAYGRRKT